MPCTLYATSFVVGFQLDTCKHTVVSNFLRVIVKCSHVRLRSFTEAAITKVCKRQLPR